MPNCLVQNCPSVKLSGCQIVHFYYLGAKLSAFIILVPNCPLYYLGAKLSSAKLSGAKLSGAKLSHHLEFDDLQKKTSKKKGISYFMKFEAASSRICCGQCGQENVLRAQLPQLLLNMAIPLICHGSHGNTRVNFFWPV